MATSYSSQPRYEKQSIAFGLTYPEYESTFPGNTERVALLMRLSNMMMKTDGGFAPAAYHRVLSRLPRTSDIDGPSWRMRAASSSGGHSGNEIAVELLRLGAPSRSHAAVPRSRRAAHRSERRGKTRSTPPLRPLMRAHRPSSPEHPQQPPPTHRHGTTAALSH